MDLASLNLITSEAIIRAEALDDLGAPGAQAAHLEVSMLEERIAELTPASSVEGAFARHGAVGAAVLAGRTDRAEALVARYDADPDASEELRKELPALVARLIEEHLAQRSANVADHFASASARRDARRIVELAEAIIRRAEPLPIG